MSDEQPAESDLQTCLGAGEGPQPAPLRRLRLSVRLRLILVAAVGCIVLLLIVAFSAAGRRTPHRTAAQTVCSTDREAAKTLAEPDAAAVDVTKVEPATIPELLGLSRPGGLSASSRLQPLETSVRQITVTLVSASVEPDGSIRVLIADPDDPSSSSAIAAEFPRAAGCGSGPNRTATQAMSDARDAFVTAFGLPGADASVPIQRSAVIAGPVLFANPDALAGGAASGVEIAPVLSMHLGSIGRAVTAAELRAATAVYRESVSAGLSDLARAVDSLQAAVAAGDLDQARPLWLAAHLSYVRLGAAYSTFGDFAGKIDGRPDGLVGGVDDPAFSGFLRLEYGLWHGQTGAELAPVADRLDQDVHDVAAAFPDLETDPLDLPRRAHEILENGLQFELNGETDEGSHTALATLRAGVDATRLALAALQPLIGPRQPQAWETIAAGLQSLADRLDAFRQADGSWTDLARLSRAQRRQLNGAVGQLLEQLAEIPDIVEPAPGP